MVQYFFFDQVPILSYHFQELLGEVFETIKRGSQSVLESDYDHFYWAIYFFTGYNYESQLKVCRRTACIFFVYVVLRVSSLLY